MDHKILHFACEKHIKIISLYCTVKHIQEHTNVVCNHALITAELERLVFGMMITLNVKTLLVLKLPEDTLVVVMTANAHLDTNIISIFSDVSILMNVKQDIITTITMSARLILVLFVSILPVISTVPVPLDNSLKMSMLNLVMPLMDIEIQENAKILICKLEYISSDILDVFSDQVL